MTKNKREVDMDKLQIVETYINNKIDLTDWIKSQQFNIVGNTMSCPFHGSDSTPSLKVNGNKWKCFGCGRGGGYLVFRQEMELLENNKKTYFDVAEDFVKNNQELSHELGGTIFKTVKETQDERWKNMIEFLESSPRKPQTVKVQSYDKLIRKARHLDIDTKIKLLSGIQSDLSFNILENIVEGTDLTGKTLFDLAN